MSGIEITGAVNASSSGLAGSQKSGMRATTALLWVNDTIADLISKQGRAWEWVLVGDSGSIGQQRCATEWWRCWTISVFSSSDRPDLFVVVSPLVQELQRPHRIELYVALRYCSSLSDRAQMVQRVRNLPKYPLSNAHWTPIHLIPPFP